MMSALTLMAERAFRLLDYTREADLHTDWTLGGAQALAAIVLSQRKDLYAALPIHARNTPHRPALICHGVTWSYSELYERAYRAALALQQRGVGRGDKVVVAFGNRAESLVCNIAVSMIGAVVVPVSTHYRHSEWQHVLANAEPKLVMILESHLHALGGLAGCAYFQPSRMVVLGEPSHPAMQRFSELTVSGSLEGAGALRIPWNEVDTTTPNLMMYTSGTTGKAKGAMLNMNRVNLARAYQLMSEFGITKHTRFHTSCPAYHAAPTVFIGLTLTLGGVVVLDDKLDAEQTWAAFSERQITHTFMVPTQLVRLLEKVPAAKLAERPSSLRRIISGGAPLPPPVKDRIAASLPNLVWDFYGATELGMVSLASPEDLVAHKGTIGRPLPGVDVKFLLPNGEEAATGEPGELYVRSDQFSFGYHKNPVATAQAQRGEFRTVSDVGYRNRDGFLFLVDRKSDLIISGGVNVYPAEIENELLLHPSVLDVAVVGVPHPEFGESIVAFVVPREPLSSEQVVAFCLQRLSKQKKPQRVVFIDELPRSPQGKVQKQTLRELVKG